MQGRVEQFLVKWHSLPYRECTWETAKDLQDEAKIAEYKARIARLNKVRVPVWVDIFEFKFLASITAHTV